MVAVRGSDGGGTLSDKRSWSQQRYVGIVTRLLSCLNLKSQRTPVSISSTIIFLNLIKRNISPDVSLGISFGNSNFTWEAA